ncbi:DUF4097 domain-containing protein [Streptomyces sp. CT1-17]|uniref:DUF4097 family beta strand repeat-containing protein n=1 Tax=Streptomyces sp. CT1-17 TaxID=2885642 RepID=UPI001D10D58A|nr:DUF4097 family beta strand repeat-containing protein [Streptomyces sp. CT1-17]MCC2267375.1 DUF4097 domain-containing protein [Streptomyces sp. CT1-17]
MNLPDARFRAGALAGGALVALGALTACGGSVDDDGPEKRDFALTGGELTIKRNSGDLEVRPADVDQVEVTRWFSGWSAVGGKPKASWELDGAQLKLNADCGAVINDCTTRYEVRVPKDVALSVEGDNGKTDAAGFGKGLRISSDNGAVHVSDVSGDVALHSGSGELKATGLAAGRVEAESDNGKVDLSFASVPDQVDVYTENGEVTVEVPDAPYKVTTETENGDVRADVPTDGNSAHAISVRTENGAITLRTAD